MKQVDAVNETLVNIFQRPFKAICFNISNELYEQYESKEVIFADAIPSVTKVVRQWKQQCSPNFFNSIFVP